MLCIKQTAQDPGQGLLVKLFFHWAFRPLDLGGATCWKLHQCNANAVLALQKQAQGISGPNVTASILAQWSFFRARCVVHNCTGWASCSQCVFLEQAALRVTLLPCGILEHHQETSLMSFERASKSASDAISAAQHDWRQH